MDRIIAGRFKTKTDADAVAALMAPYVGSEDLCIFQNNPPGQHDAPDGGDEAEASKRRPGGVMLSVRITSQAREKLVLATLRAEGAADIEQAQGEWLDGDWTDFDPVAPPRLM